MIPICFRQVRLSVNCFKHELKTRKILGKLLLVEGCEEILNLVDHISPHSLLCFRSWYMSAEGSVASSFSSGLMCLLKTCT